MGVDYSSYAVIGIEIDETKIVKETFKRKAFKHNFPENIKFDPQTGKKLWEESELPAVYFEDGKMYAKDEDAVNLHQYGFSIFTNTDDQRKVIGFGLCADDDADVRFDNAIDMGLIEARLGELLEPFGLWDQSKFGLYAIQHCSY